MEQLDKIDKVKLAYEICENIRGARPNEFYDSEQDPLEATDAVICDFLGEIYTIVDEIMTKEFIDENGDIKELR